MQFQSNITLYRSVTQYYCWLRVSAHNISRHQANSRQSTGLR